VLDCIPFSTNQNLMFQKKLQQFQFQKTLFFKLLMLCAYKNDLTVMYEAWTSAKLVTGWRSCLPHIFSSSPPSPHSWSSHNSSKLKMPYVTSALSADEKELKLTYFLLYSLSSPHPRHHAYEVWWIVYKFHIPQKLCLSDEWLRHPQTTKCSYLAHHWRHPVPLELKWLWSCEVHAFKTGFQWFSKRDWHQQQTE
jgi:hypothetical protein